MQYGDKLFVINSKKLCLATFLMETPDTHKYIVECDKCNSNCDFKLEKVCTSECLNYEEESIITFYDKLIQETTKKAEKLAYLINNKDKQMKIYDARIKQTEKEIKSMKIKIKKDNENGDLYKECIKCKYAKRLNSIFQKERGIKRLYKKKNKLNYEADYKWMTNVNRYIKIIEKFEIEKQNLLSILRQNK